MHEGSQLKLVTRIDISGATVTQSGMLTYNGSAQTPAFTVVVNGTTLTPGVDYTVSGSQINAGTYTGASAATIRGIGGYSGTASGSWSIAKANPALGTHYTSDIAAARTYDGGAKAVMVTASGSYAGLGAAAITYTGTGGTTYGPSTTAPIGAGSYTVSVTFDEGVNFNAATTAVALGTITVMKAAAPTGVDQTRYVSQNNVRNYDFDLTTLLPDVSPLALGTVTYAVASVANGDGVLETVPSGAVASPLSLSVANVTGAGKTAILTMVISSTNYSDFTAHITVETVSKIPVTISAIMSGGVYNGNGYGYTSATVKNSANDQPVTGLLPEALYESTDGGGYSSSTAPANAGAYKLTLSIPASNPDYCGSEVFSFAITPKMVTVKADDKTITRGDALPAPTVSYSGFIGPDNEANVLASQATARFNVANSNTAGISTIDFATQAVLNGTNGANYTLDHQNGTLTVNLAIGDSGALAVDPGYLMLEKSDSGTLTARINGEPVPAAIPVTWSSSNESVAMVADGMVTAIGAGSCYVTAAVTVDGEKYSASALIDVVDDTSSERDIDRAHLEQTTVTVNILSDIGAKVGLVYETQPEASRQLNPLQSRAPAMSSPITMDGYTINLLSDKKDKQGNDVPLTPALDAEIRRYFEISLTDDRTVEIVRKAGENFSKIKASYKFRIELVKGDHKITIPEALTVKVAKTAPVIKAGAHKFNTFFDDHKLRLTLTSVNGRVISAEAVQGTKNPLPDWIKLDSDMTIMLNTATYNTYAKKPTSAKIDLMVTVEGYDPVPFTLTVSAARTVPGLKLSVTSVTVMSNEALSQGVAMKVLTKSAKDTLVGIGVTYLTLNDSTYEVKDYDPATGGFILAVKANQTPAAKTLTLQAEIMGTAQAIPLTLKTAVYAATKVPTIKASAGTVTLNTELGIGNDIATVKLTPTPTDLNLASLRVVAIKEGKVDAPSDVLEIDLSADGRSVTIKSNNITPPGKTYTVTLQTDEVFGAKQVPAKISITVKTLALGKGVVTATISAKGKLNTINPDSTITITPKFKNYNGTVDASAFIITATDSKKNPIADAGSWFTLSANGDGSFTLGFDKDAWAQGLIRPEYKYTVKLPQMTAIGEKPLAKDASVSFTVAQGAVKFTQSVKTVTLYKANAHSSAMVTISTGGVPLPDSARVVIDKAATSPFEILPLGNGQYAIRFKGYVPAAKAGTVKLNVYLEGNYDPATDAVGAKANGSVSVSVKLN